MTSDECPDFEKEAYESESAIVSWFRGNKTRSSTSMLFYELLEKGWKVPSTDAEAKE